MESELPGGVGSGSGSSSSSSSTIACPSYAESSSSSGSRSRNHSKRRRIEKETHSVPCSTASTTSSSSIEPVPMAPTSPSSPPSSSSTSTVMRIPGRGGGPRGGRKAHVKGGGGGGDQAHKGSRAAANNGGRSRPATRARHSTILTPADQEGTEVALTRTLRSMGLYAAKTQGDGNCMFRALSDQLYGHDGKHAILRRQVCDHIAARESAYAGFVDTERPFADYVRAMRERGTYGGHMELTAFARLKRRSIKVILPDYVYVVAGTDDDDDNDQSPASSSKPAHDSRSKSRLAENDHASSAASTAPADDNDEEDSLEPDAMLYLSYHIFEHYSSVRNLAGPHKGLPRVVERNALAEPVPASSSSSSGNKSGGGLSVEKRQDLVFQSLPPHIVPSPTKVETLLDSNNGDWGKVIEILIEEDAAEAQVEEGLVVADSASEASGGSPPLQDGTATQPPPPPPQGTAISVPAMMLYRDSAKTRGTSPFATSDDVETNTSASDGFATPIGAGGDGEGSSSPAGSQATNESSVDSAVVVATTAKDSKASRPGSGRKRQLTSTSVVEDCRIKPNPAAKNEATTSSRPAVGKALGRNMPKARRGSKPPRLVRQQIEADAWGAASTKGSNDKRVTRSGAKKLAPSTDNTVTVTSNGIRQLYI